jgi:8-oxo-dGTP pyrophosphatase MutT (NUDIX family)
MAPPIVRDAATVILTRPSRDGLEVLLLKRHSASGFMAGAFVFPGGKVDEADRSAAHTFAHARLDATPGRTLLPEDESAIWVAARRETAEEAGIHVELDALVYWAHWITPSVEPKRFDTRFFVTEVPPDQTLATDPREVTEARWMTARAALAAHERREIFLPPPTQRTLEELEPYATFLELCAAAATRTIAPILPKVTGADGGFLILLPWDPLYEATDGEGVMWPGPTPLGRSRILLEADHFSSMKR